MTKDSTGPKVWTKPQIKRLGEIKDVANSTQAPLTQTTQSKS